MQIIFMPTGDLSPTLMFSLTNPLSSSSDTHLSHTFAAFMCVRISGQYRVAFMQLLQSGKALHMIKAYCVLSEVK